MSRTRAVLVALLLPLVGLAACTDDDPEPAPPLPTTEAPTSPSATTAAPDDPEETVRAWVEAQNDAFRTGDTAPLRALSAPDCRGCRDFINAIDVVYENGGNFQTTGWTVNAAKVRSGSADPVRVDVGISMASGKTTPSAGAKPIPFSKSSRIMAFEVIDGPDGMQVSFVGFVE